jgi:hypothetical protein|tara:strand:+ start:486 stop:797 length:312 start_codon:yes stop_codon:yes gene_type:complete
MLKSDHIPVLTDLIEKGTDIKLTELEHNEDLIVGANRREEPHINVAQLYFKEEIEAEAGPTSPTFTNDDDLEKTIQNILNEHMKQILTEIKLAIQKTGKSSFD